MKALNRLAILAMALLLAIGTAGAALLSDEEFVGPFPSWMNVKTAYGAVGDGKADDTAALQNALNALANNDPAARAVLYLPAGTYRITRGLTMTSHMYVEVLGEDPAKTIIKWDGGDEGIMLLCNGVRYSKIGRLTWDGGGKPVTAIWHRWDGHTPNAATGLEHADEVFTDVAFGIRAGTPHFMDAECLVLRCTFQRCSQAGLSIESFNALDWWVWYGRFIDCKLGATNAADGQYGGGHFHVYESLFQRSKVADIRIGHASYFGIRNNTSLGSKAFFLGVRPSVGAGAWAPEDTWGAQLIVQGNTILDPQDATPIRIASSPSLLLLDNTIRSRPGTTAPLVEINAPGTPAIVAVGNTVTAANPYTTSGKVTDIDTKIVAPGAIATALPELPGTPPRTERKIFEVPPTPAARCSRRSSMRRQS